jgi:nucleoid-associated protein YgaU
MTSKHSAVPPARHRLGQAVLALILLAAVATAGALFARQHHHRSATPAPASVSPSTVVNPPSPPSSTAGPGLSTTPAATPSLVHSTARHVPTPLQYRVKPGDTLWDIADWFKFNGYQGLYQANWKRLGGDPSLIHPGTVIQISDGAMTVYSCPKALAGVC